MAPILFTNVPPSMLFQPGSSAPATTAAKHMSTFLAPGRTSGYFAYPRAVAVIVMVTRRVDVVDDIYDSFAALAHFANLDAGFQ